MPLDAKISPIHKSKVWEGICFGEDVDDWAIGCWLACRSAERLTREPHKAAQHKATSANRFLSIEQATGVGKIDEGSLMSSTRGDPGHVQRSQGTC